MVSKISKCFKEKLDRGSEMDGKMGAEGRWTRERCKAGHLPRQKVLVCLFACLFVYLSVCFFGCLFGWFFVFVVIVSFACWLRLRLLLQQHN